MSASLHAFPRTACLALGLVLALGACSKSSPTPGGLGDPCINNVDCATGFLCSGGACVLPANLGGCEAGLLRCNGADVEKCDTNGEAWQVVSTCATGCVSGACAPQVCAPQTFHCDGDFLEQCNPAGSAYEFVRDCPSQCDAATNTCKAQICVPFETQCSADHKSVLTCDSFGASEVTSACPASEICDTGRCQTTVCLPGAQRCASGNASLESCNALGDGWVAGAACPFSCGTNATGGACLPAACTPGETLCSGSALEQCLPDQTGYGFVTFCSSGCVQSGGAAADAGTDAGAAPTSAACAQLTCTPLSRKCEPDGKSVDTCNQLGTGYSQTDVCPQGCSAGQCVTDSAGCTAGELRCNGLDTQVCAAVPNDPGVTQWTLTGTCLAGCSSGACLPGGSCAALNLELGAPLDAGVATAPADGISSVLVYSDVILGADGARIPDGQLFTLSATISSSTDGGSPAQLALSTADADPATPGVQVATHSGRIRFSVPATALDAGSATVQIAAQLEQGGSCAATASFSLSTDPAVLGATVLLAEDFSTTTDRDAANTTANWSTTQQALLGAFPDAVGNGGDGSLAVPANATFNLTSSGYAPAFAVLGLSADSASIDGPAQGLSGGDEVILWDAQGSAAGAGNAGTFELLTVQSTSGSTVTFTTAIQNSYGAAADQDVATQRVSLQRIPHFSTLTVPPGATLTTNAWDGTKGGLVFLRASKLVLGGAPASTTAAIIDVSGLGFRGENAGTNGSTATAGEDATGVAGQDAAGGGAGGVAATGAGGSYGTAGTGSAVGAVYGSKLLGKLFLGAGGGASAGGNAGGNGGGAALIFADSIDFTSGGSAVGLVRANGANAASAGAGAGGTVWIGSPNIAVGTAVAGGSATVAQASGGAGGNSGGNGRIRVDAETLDSAGFGGAACTRTAPACTYGIDGPLQAQSLPLFTLPGNVSTAVIQASLLVALDATPGIAFSAAATQSSDPSAFGPVSTTSPVKFFSGSTPHSGPTFIWRASLAPDPATGPASVGGLQWQLQVK